MLDAHALGYRKDMNLGVVAQVSYLDSMEFSYRQSQLRMLDEDRTLGIYLTYKLDLPSMKRS